MFTLGQPEAISTSPPQQPRCHLLVEEKLDYMLHLQLALSRGKYLDRVWRLYWIITVSSDIQSSVELWLPVLRPITMCPWK